MRKKFVPLEIFLALSLAFPLFIMVFENLPSFMYIPGREWNVSSYPISESGEIQQENYLMLKVLSNFPLLFWRLITYNYYDSFRWRTTTSLTPIEPPQHTSNATHIFTVEVNATTDEFYLPTPSSTSTIFNLTLSPNVKFRLFFDEVADVYKVRMMESVSQVKVIYQVSWNFSEIVDNAISLDDIPEEIRQTYLQLPNSLPVEVKLLAESLKNLTLTAFEQVIKDVEYIVNNFEYDLDFLAGRTQRLITRDWVLTFLKRRKGICIDSATALAVILRCQGIPARVCCGFKPSDIVNDNVLYYSTGAHALTEVYLPPYGWIQFDATPAAELDLLPEDFPPWRPSGNKAPPVCFLRTLTPSTLIRGGENQIKGLITTNMEEKIEAYVRISLDDREIATVKTEANGSFAYMLNIPYDEELGKHTLTFGVESKNLTLEQEVRIVAKTFLNATVIKKEMLGNLLIVSAQLFDDKMVPLEGRAIIIENLDLLWETDKEGKAEFSLEFVPEILPQDIYCIVSFEGSDEYLGSKVVIQMIIEPNPIVLFLLLIGVCLVIQKENIIPKLFTKDFRKKDAARMRTKIPSSLFFGKDFKSTGNSKLRICFPEIGDWLPKVWGIEDKILIKCSLENDSENVSSYKLKVFTNDICVFEKVVDDDQTFAFHHAFEKKGLQKISAVLYDDSDNPKEVAEVALRVVDYREEIIRLYGTFLQSLVNENDLNVKEYMTAREIEDLSLKVGVAYLIAKCITKCFEEAEYSHHSINRKNYETIYFALKELRVSVD